MDIGNLDLLCQPSYSTSVPLQEPAEQHTYRGLRKRLVRVTDVMVPSGW